jgi:hypothetical protein
MIAIASLLFSMNRWGAIAVATICAAEQGRAGLRERSEEARISPAVPRIAT